MNALTTFLFLSYCVKGVLSQDKVVSGTTYTITCSLSGVTYPQWTKDGVTDKITVVNDPAINTAFPGHTRFAYASNNLDLVITNVQSGDAGTYVCSVATPTSRSDSVTFTVDVVAITDSGCPEEESGFPFITCACATENDVKQECKHIFLDYKNKETKVCPTLNVTTNSTGCSAGLVQETAGFQYQKSKSTGKLRVHFKCNLLHSTTGDREHDSRTCSHDYYVDPCSFELIIIGYILCGLSLIFSFIGVAGIIKKLWKSLVHTDMCRCWFCKKCKLMRGKDIKPWILLLIVEIVVFLVSLIWLIVLILNPVLPDGDVPGCCDHTHGIVFVVIMGIFTVVEIVLLIGVLYWNLKGTLERNGGPQTTSPLTTCMATCTTALNSSPGNTEEKKKSRNNTKFKLQETGNETQTKPRPLPEKPIKAEPLQMKKPSPGIQDNKSSGREDSAVSRSDVQVHHRDHLSDDDHPHNRTQRGLSATIDQGHLPKLPPIDSTEKKSKRK